MAKKAEKSRIRSRKSVDETHENTPARASKPITSFSKDTSVKSLEEQKRRPKIQTTREQSQDDLERLASDVALELAETWGLSSICDHRLLAEVARDVASSISQTGREVTRDAVMRTLMQKRDHVFKYIAVKLLEKSSDNLTNDQLEFIIVNAPEIAGSLAPHLYGLLVERGLLHLVDTLRDLWSMYGKPLPVKCPYCGFQSVTPNYQCLICNKAPSEDEVKASMRFEELLRLASQSMPTKLLEEIVFAGYVVFDGEIKPPSMKASAGPIVYTITLSKREKNMLKDIILSKKQS